MQKKKIDLKIRHRLKQSKGSERLSLSLDLSEELNDTKSSDLDDGAEKIAR